MKNYTYTLKVKDEDGKVVAKISALDFQGIEEEMYKIERFSNAIKEINKNNEELEDEEKQKFIDENKEELEKIFSKKALEEGMTDDDLPDYCDNYLGSTSLEDLNELIK